MKPQLVLFVSTLTLPVALVAQVASVTPPPLVPYPDGYRQWLHVSSAIHPPKQTSASDRPNNKGIAARHGLIHHLYANNLAVEGYRTGHFSEGAVLIADFLILQEKGPDLAQGPRKSINVMIRDARYTETGGWGFEDFDQDSHIQRNVGPSAVKACFECHSRAKEHEFVFSTLKP